MKEKELKYATKEHEVGYFTFDLLSEEEINYILTCLRATRERRWGITNGEAALLLVFDSYEYYLTKEIPISYPLLDHLLTKNENDLSSAVTTNPERTGCQKQPVSGGTCKAQIAGSYSEYSGEAVRSTANAARIEIFNGL